ncbi:MAG: MFS transporter [Promethearchaeota archaeon]
MVKKFSKYPQLKPLWIAVFVDILGFTIILPFLPVLATEYTNGLPFGTLLLGLLIASNAIFGFIFSTILGNLSDKYGRKPLLLISQAGTVTAFLLLAFANSLEMLFVSRIIDGIFGGQFPISKAVISDVVPPRERGKQMTNIGVAFSLAAVFGPALGGTLSGLFGIIGPGLLASGVATFTLIFTAMKYRETLPTKIENPPEWIVEMVKSQSIGENHTDGGASSIIRNRRALYMLLVYSLMVVAATTFQTSFSLFASDDARRLDTFSIGLLFTFMGLFQVFYRYVLFNKIRLKLGDTKTAMIGMVNYIFAYLVLSIAVGFWTLLPALFYISSCGAMSRGIILSFTSRMVDFKNQGKIMGVTTSIDNFSQIIGPLIGTNLLAVDTVGFAFILFLSFFSSLAFLLGLRLPSFNFDAPRTPNIYEGV